MFERSLRSFHAHTLSGSARSARSAMNSEVENFLIFINVLVIVDYIRGIYTESPGRVCLGGQIRTGLCVVVVV